MMMRRLSLQRLCTSAPTSTSLFLLALPILMGLFFLATPLASWGQSEPDGSQERLQVLLTERYDLLKEMYATLQDGLQYGRVTAAQWREATVRLHHAEADLCTTQAGRVKVYEKLVEALRVQEDMAVRRVEAGRIDKAEITAAHVATLEAQIELERARLGR